MLNSPADNQTKPTMKITRLLIAGALFICSFTTQAQTDTIAKTPGTVEALFTVQAGLVGGYANYEEPLGKQWALRGEVGLDLFYYEAYIYNGTSLAKDKGTFFAPQVTLEPRWYYNIEKRAQKGRHTENNSANYFSLAIKFYPDLFKIGGPDYVNVPDQLSFIPKWGIRRAIAKSNFNYELAFGVGYMTYLSDTQFLTSKDDVAIDLHVRIGYTIK
jgi:hypothetical protein